MDNLFHLKRALLPDLDDPRKVTVREIHAWGEIFFTAGWASEVDVDFADSDDNAEVFKQVFEQIRGLGAVPVEYIVEFIGR